MRFLRFVPALAVSLAAAGTLSVPAAFAAHSVFAKGGQPSCDVAITSPASSSTSCSGTFSGEDGVPFLVNVAVDGVAVYQCQDATGAVTRGQNQVPAEGGSTTSSTPTKKSPTFTTDPAVLTAPATVSASQAGCAGGSTAVDPSLTTTKVQLWIGAVGDGTLVFNCAAFDPSGISGTVPFTSC
jgi:hypothetical protein